MFNYTSYSFPFKEGDRYFISIRKANEDQEIIYSLKSLNDTSPTVFIDPNKFSNDGTVSLSFTVFSPDGKWCAYGKSVGGSDWISIKIKNVETMQDLDETLTKIKFSSVAWNKNYGFFYSVK